MQINESVHLVVPVVSGESGVRIWAYHTPISREVFEANYRALSATKAALSSKGAYYAMDAGPCIAALTLRDEGLKDAESRGQYDSNGNIVDESTTALLAEIKRLTNVLCPGAAGWDLLPVDAAISAGKIDAEDWAEAESAIVFFTSHWSMARKAERSRLARSTASVLKGSITSLSPTEFGVSLPTSIAGATSPKKAVSSDPS